MLRFSSSKVVPRFATHRPCWTRLGQARGYQAALKVPQQESALPNFTYKALLVDAAGTLLLPSEPAAEV